MQMWCRQDLSIENIAHIYGLLNTIFSSAELLCYTVLCSALHVILERQKAADIKVCDMSFKSFDDPDDCEIKAARVVAALLATSVFDVLLSFLALRGAHKGNVCFCYIWFIFTSLLILLFPLLQSVLFIVTTWWNAISYAIITVSIIHSIIKVIGMFIIIQYVKWVREASASGAAREGNPNIGISQLSWSIGQQNDDDDVVLPALAENSTNKISSNEKGGDDDSSDT